MALQYSEKDVCDRPDEEEEEDADAGDDEEWQPPPAAELKVLEARRERSDRIAKIMGGYLLKGYKMLATICPVCSVSVPPPTPRIGSAGFGSRTRPALN